MHWLVHSILISTSCAMRVRLANGQRVRLTIEKYDSTGLLVSNQEGPKVTSQNEDESN